MLFNLYVCMGVAVSSALAFPFLGDNRIFAADSTVGEAFTFQPLGGSGSAQSQELRVTVRIDAPNVGSRAKIWPNAFVFSLISFDFVIFRAHFFFSHIASLVRAACFDGRLFQGCNQG